MAKGRMGALKVVNPLMFLAFLGVAGVAVGRLAGLVGYELFGKVHRPAGIAFITLAVVHLVLNWGWISTNLLGGGRRRG